MPNAPINPEHVQGFADALVDGPIDPGSRRRLLTLFLDGLARASTEVARGRPGKVLAAQIEGRIAELQRQIAAATTDSER